MANKMAEAPASTPPAMKPTHTKASAVFACVCVVAQGDIGWQVSGVYCPVPEGPLNCDAYER